MLLIQQLPLFLALSLILAPVSSINTAVDNYRVYRNYCLNHIINSNTQNRIEADEKSINGLLDNYLSKLDHCFKHVLRIKTQDRTAADNKFTSGWGSPLAFHRLLRHGFPRIMRTNLKRFDHVAFPKSEKICKQRYLYVPVPLHKLEAPFVVVLPNRQVLINGRKLHNSSMPEDPVVIPVMVRDKPGSLFMSSSLGLFKKWNHVGNDVKSVHNHHQIFRNRLI